MFSTEDIKNDYIFKEFIKDKNLAQSSKNIYAYRLKHFSDFIDKSPLEIVKSYDPNYFEKNMFKYIQNLKNKGVSKLTIQNKLDTLRTFYNQYNITIPSINDFNGEIEFEDQFLNKSHIQKALNVINERDRSIILLQFTSGISPQILRNLTYNHFIHAMKDYLEDYDDVLDIKKMVNHLSKRHELIGKWMIRKNSRIFYTFNTTESSRAILDYLMHREISNNTVKNLEDPLFVNQENMKLKKSTYDGIFTRVNKKADFKLLSSNKRFFTPMNLKKAFRNALSKSCADKVMIDAISGHKSVINWDNEDIENFKIKYKRSSKFLIIEEDDLQSLKNRLEQNYDEISQLKNEIKYLQHLMAQNYR